MFRNILILVVVFLSFFEGWAQEYSIIDKRAIKYFEEGEAFLMRKQFDEAMEKYQSAYERSSDFFEAYIRHSQVILSRGKAEESLEIAQMGERRVKNNDFFKGQFGWLISRIYLKQGDFEKGLEKYERSKPYFTESFKASKHYQESIDQINFIASAIRDPKSIEKEKLPLPLNQFRLQYFPVLTADSKRMFFTKRDGLQPNQNEDIFISNQINGVWTTPESISSLINTKYNEGTCTISADGNILIFTSCDTPDSFGSCDLYLTQKVSGQWQKPINMGREVNSREWDSQPSLSADGSLLYFSSNRPEGHGGNDIWFTERKPDGTWSNARNLGPKINTVRDEVSPFIFFNNLVLFFASDGHPGFGGKDLYMSNYGLQGFEGPENLGYPINDQNDQLALFISAQKDYAYYTENVFEGGKVDGSYLYRFGFPKEIDLGEEIIVTEGTVINKDTGNPVEANLSLVDLSNDSTLYKFQSDGKTGTFTMLYPDKVISGLYVEKKGFIPKIYNVEKDSLENRKNLEIYLEPIASGKFFVFENIFFDFDQSELKEESISSLKRLFNFLENHPDVSILIVGHTDNVGNAAYNDKLSKQRAERVSEYLITLGIASNRLETKGYGDQAPLVPNDSEENRALNRRIEVIIL
ncbi:MAG: OmpA family protein [Cyclobacteriaceae bacterium]